MKILLAAVAGLGFGLITFRLHFLNLTGSIAGGLLALSLVGLGDLQWITPAFTFFITSSLLSKVGKKKKAKLEATYEKGSVRDAGQVLANGGVAWLLLLFYALFPFSIFYMGFLGAIAAAAADTWATEIGTLIRNTPRLITTGRKVAPGTSGAVSISGTIGAFLGSAAVIASAVPFLTQTIPVLCLVFAGLIASLVDSLTGALLQAKYRDPVRGQLTERSRSTSDHELVAGYRWITNDMVNFVCTLTGAFVAMACFT